MTTSAEVRRGARDYLVYAALASVIGVFAFAYDGIYIGATWTRDMRNLMIVSLALYLAAWWVLRPLRQCRAVDRDPGLSSARAARCRRRAIRRSSRGSLDRPRS